MRLHPLPDGTATVAGAHRRPGPRSARRPSRWPAQPLEADCLDVDWRDGAGRLLLRFGGAAAGHQAAVAAERVRAAGLEDVETIEDDDELWMRQRAHQRGAAGYVRRRSSGRITDLPAVSARRRTPAARVVGRAGLGLSWLTVPADSRGRRSATALAPRACTILDAPAALRADAWPAPEPGRSR